MLVINKKYASISKILSRATNESEEIEEAYDIGIDFSADQAIEQIFKLKSGLDDQDKANITRLVKDMYSIWQKDLHEDPRSIPFRFSSTNKVVKVANVYNQFLQQGDLVKYGASTTNDGKFFIGPSKSRGVIFTFGEGSLFSSKSKAGLGYEDVVRDQLIQIIHYAAEFKKNPSEKNIIENTDKRTHHLLPIYTAGLLNDAIKLYRDNRNLDLNEIVIKHKGSTARNSNNELWDANFNIDLDNNKTEEVLKSSGAIVADVIVNTKNPVYLSVKKPDAQLSGVCAKEVMETNKAFKNGIATEKKYKDVKNTLGAAYFNFCKTTGIDPEELYNKYLAISLNHDVSPEFENVLKGESDKLGAIFQRLVGGNYWYVKPDKVVYIDYKDNKLKFNVSSIKFSRAKRELGRKIIIYGKIDGYDGIARIEFRTADVKYKYPYRMFPIVNVPALRESMAKNSK